MKTSDILRGAKSFLWDGYGSLAMGDPSKSEFVCHAIDNFHYLSKRANKLREKKVDDLTNEIHDRMNPPGGRHCSTIFQWLITKGFDVDQPTFIRQDYRNRWIDSMIAEYEAKGD